jgi:MFS family permease
MQTKYRDVLSRPGAVMFSSAALVSRLPMSMTAFGIVLLVSARTDSYGRAGVLAAVYVLAAALFAPTQGRLADRLGQSTVLWAVGAVYAVGMTMTLLAIGQGWASPWPHLCVAVAGLATPQTGSMVRARWTHVVADRSQLNTAFSIEAVLDEVVFMVGPLLVTVLTLQVSDFAGVGFATGAAALGSWALAAQRRTEPPIVAHEPGARPAINWGLLGPLVAASAGLGVLFGSTEVIIVAFCSEEGHRGAAGFVIAVWATGSLIAGIVVGALPTAPDPLRRFRTSQLALALLFAPLSVLSGIPLIAVGMFLTGFMNSPTLISTVHLIERHVPSSRLTEALTWTTTGLAVGIAPGTAIAGWVIDRYGASAGFLVPLAAGLVAAAVAWSIRVDDDRAAG